VVRKASAKPIPPRASRPQAAAAARRDSVDAQVREALEWLQRHGTQARRDGMARYAIPLGNAFGVSMPDIQSQAKCFGRDHELAAALWDSGQYEARLLAAYVDDPARVTATQMDCWARAFDNWAVCDTVCFVLFDRTAHAWRKVERWSSRPDEFVKRAAFALLASLTVHDKQAGDALFVAGLALIEREAGDERNFVRKAVNWALRSIGKRNSILNAAALALARRLAGSAEAAPRWVGKSALRELGSDAVARRLATKAKPARKPKGRITS
jgi:3-methyladenine DNA glycosylase AlkD